MSNFRDVVPTEVKVSDDLALNRTTIDSADDNIRMVWANMERFHRFPWANHNYNLEHFTKWVNNLESLPNICEFDYRRNGELIGRIAVRLQEDGNIGFGYLLSIESEGYGYVSQAIQALIQSLSDLGYNVFEVIYNKDNVRSKAVAMRNGFLEIGVTANPYNKDEFSFLRARLSLTPSA